MEREREGEREGRNLLPLHAAAHAPPTEGIPSWTVPVDMQILCICGAALAAPVAFITIVIGSCRSCTGTPRSHEATAPTWVLGLGVGFTVSGLGFRI